MAIYDTMQLVRPDVATWAVGLAASMGQFLLTAGAPGKRYALPHARILMHQPSASLGGTATGTGFGYGAAVPHEVREGRVVPGSVTVIRAGVFGEMKREIAELTARHSGQPVETVTADADRDRWFDAEQARAYGLVDHVAGRSGPTAPTRRIGFLGEGRWEFAQVTRRVSCAPRRSRARRDGQVRCRRMSCASRRSEARRDGQVR